MDRLSSTIHWLSLPVDAACRLATFASFASCCRNVRNIDLDKFQLMSRLLQCVDYVRSAPSHLFH